MKRILYLTLVVMFFCTQLQAGVYVIFNGSQSPVDLSSLQEAHDLASAGDTIMVMPSTIDYPGIQVSKELTIIGGGFGRPSYIDPVFPNITTISGTMHFLDGAEGSTLMGFAGFITIIIEAENISVIKNQINSIALNSEADGFLILQNQIIYTGTESAINLGGSDDGTIMNNTIYNSTGQASYNRIGLYGYGSANIFVQHNIFDFYTPFSNSGYGVWAIRYLNDSIVANNIFLFGDVYTTRTLITYNARDEYCDIPLNNNNIAVISNNIVAGPHTGIYYIPADSPVIGAGFNGVDIGAFGGETPFSRYGLPNIPYISSLVIDPIGTVGEGLNIQLEATTPPR